MKRGIQWDDIWGGEKREKEKQRRTTLAIEVISKADWSNLSICRLDETSNPISSPGYCRYDRTDLPNSRKERPWTSLTFKEGRVKIRKSNLSIKSSIRSPIYSRFFYSLRRVSCFTFPNFRQNCALFNVIIKYSQILKFFTISHKRFTYLISLKIYLKNMICHKLRRMIYIYILNEYRTYRFFPRKLKRMKRKRRKPILSFSILDRISTFESKKLSTASILDVQAMDEYRRFHRVINNPRRTYNVYPWIQFGNNSKELECGTKESDTIRRGNRMNLSYKRLY